LMWALVQKQAAVADALIRAGADVNAGSKNSFTPMMFAAQQGDVDSIRTLLRAGAKLNDFEPGTVTPLIIAAAMVHVDAVNLMLDNGADPNTADWRGYTPMLLVVRDSHYGLDLANKDKIVTINFIYSTCADGTCPLITANLVQVQRLLGKRVGRDIFMYSITLNPRHDTPRVLKRYAGAYNVGPGWQFLTGPPDDIEFLRRKLRFTDIDPEIDKDPSRHSGNVRYGNEPLMQWAMCQGQATPRYIADSILWVVPKPA